MTPAATFQIADLFEAVAERIAGRCALAAGDERRTFRELDERATRVANYLLSLGLPPGARVGIYSWNRAEWVEALLGVLKARLVPININYRYVAAELGYVFDNADLDALVFERGFAPRAAEASASVPGLRHFVVLEDGTATDASFAVPYEEAVTAASSSRAAIERSSDDLYVVYTGGTTGMPKGVMWRQEDLFHAALGGSGFGPGPLVSPGEIVDRIAPEPQTISLITAPLMHGAAQWNMLYHLLGGRTVVLYTGRTFDADAVCRLIEQERCTSVSLIGDAMARPLAEALDRSAGRYDLSSLVVINSAGAIFSRAVKDQLRSHLPEVLLVDAFGSSETGGSSVQLDPEQGARFPRNETTDVLGDDLRPVAPGSGVVGRLARCGHLPLGYHKDEAKTAATFVLDPHGTRWAITGDHATVEADGMVALLGRGSFCINTGGEKVYPEEVEAALKSHPDVFDVLVIGMPDERFGERVAAIVQARADRTPTLEALSAHCRSMIAGYKVPRHLTLVDVVSRTASGKGDYAWAKRVVT